MVITSLDNDKVKKFRKLQKKKFRDQYNQYIVEGKHLVIEAFKMGVLEELILLENEDLPLPSPYNYYSSEVISKISMMDTPSSVMGLCHKREKENITGKRILVLDDIQDPGNLGTIIRSAAAFNVDTIILTENTVDLYNPKVLRATQGMLYYVNIITRTDVELESILKNIDIPVYGTDVYGGVQAATLTKDEKSEFVLVMGNEGNGVRDNIKAVCDRNLYIPMNKDVESLNVAVATSILLYEMER